MLKIEKKLLLWTEKHMFLLMAVLGAAVALYLRRTAIWWSSPEVVYYFDGHGNNIQSSFYFLVIQLFQHLPILPLHGIKWLAGLADYVAAVQKRQGLYVSCIEEIAYKRGFIDREQLTALAQPLLKTNYGQYLMDVADGL